MLICAQIKKIQWALLVKSGVYLMETKCCFEPTLNRAHLIFYNKKNNLVESYSTVTAKCYITILICVYYIYFFFIYINIQIVKIFTNKKRTYAHIFCLNKHQLVHN